MANNRKLIAFAIVCSFAAIVPATAQGDNSVAPVIELSNGTCSNTQVACRPPGTYLVNRNTSDRVVVTIERTVVGGASLGLRDRHLRRASQPPVEMEVLMRSGQHVRLLSGVNVQQHFVKFSYRVVGHVIPRADDINDVGAANAEDYLRINETRKPFLDQSNICHDGVKNNPHIGLALVNLHPTRRLAVVWRNTAKRYGVSGAEWRSEHLEPGVDGPEIGCVIDLPDRLLEISEVRWAD